MRTLATFGGALVVVVLLLLLYPKQIIGPKSVINVFHVMPNDERVTN